MKTDRGVLLFLARGAMELCWLYACATFLITAILQHPFPLPEAIGTFFLATALSRLVRGMGLRVVSILALHTTGFLLAASRLIYTLNYRAYSYFSKAWMTEFLGKTRDSRECLILVIILIFALVFWIAGVAFAKGSTTHLSVCTRFDYGVTAFFCLFILKSLLLVKGGIEVENTAPVFLLFPFFFFSFLAIGLTRNIDKKQRNFLAGYRGVGMFLSFTAVVFVIGAGLVLFFMTYMSAAAETGYGILKAEVGPLLPVLERVLFILFGKLPEHNAFVPPPDRDKPEYVPSGESSGWSEDLVWGIFGLLILIGLIFCALGVWRLMRWLLLRTPKEERKHIDWRLVLLWAQRLWAALNKGFNWSVQRLKGYRDAVQIYIAFLKWGRRSGIPHRLSETPGEYGSRVQMRFPSLSGEIGMIVETFNLVVYAELNLEEEQITRVKLSWKRMRSARYWPARMKSWFPKKNG
jgi:hypothetical protein